MISSSSCPSTHALFELRPCCLEQFGNPSPQSCIYYLIFILWSRSCHIVQPGFRFDPAVPASWIPGSQHDCCAGLHLPLLQSVVGWPWTWNNPLASVSQTLRLQFMCHCAWLFGLILESGPVSLSSSCPLHIDINIIGAADRGTVVRKPLSPSTCRFPFSPRTSRALGPVLSFSMPCMWFHPTAD